VSLALSSCAKRPTSDFKVALLTPGPISDAAWNAGAYEGLIRIRDSLGAQVSHVETKTPAEFEEGFRDFASRGYRLVIGHGFEFQDAAARDSIIAGTLRVPTVEFEPDSIPVARR
jgi:basic membrane lipoprotein Med (substrate-binding protein (PBP1-ABC) superfamily)